MSDTSSHYEAAHVQVAMPLHVAPKAWPSTTRVENDPKKEYKRNSQGFWPDACQIMDKLPINPVLPINSSTHHPATHHPINTSHLLPTSHQHINPSPINPSSHQYCPSTHQPISPSIHVCYVCYAYMYIERAHGCLGAWEGGPVVPGPPPLGR